MNSEFSKENFIRLRIVSLLSLLFLARLSFGGCTAVEGNENIEKEWQSWNEGVDDQASPLRQQSRLRFALVDIELSFWYLPANVTTNVLGIVPFGTIQTATRHFLAHGLNEDPSTSVIDLNVLVISQNDIIKQSSTTATILDIGNADSIASHVLTTKLEITIQYELKIDSPQLNDMAERIKGLFSGQAHELLDLLVLLDKDFFATVFAIGSESSKTPIMVSEKTNSNEARSDDEASKWQSLGLFVLVGLTGLICVGIGIILLCMLLPHASNANKRSGRRTKKITMELPIPSVLIHNTITENTSDDHHSLTQSSKTMLQNDSLSKDSIESSSGRTSSTFSSKKYENVEVKPSNDYTEESYTAFPKRGIQAIYSEDKLRNPIELNIQELRTKKEDAEHNLKSYITGYCSRRVSIGEPMETSKSSEPTHNSRMNFSQIRMKEQNNDIESQIQILKNKRNAIEQRIREKYETLIAYIPPESREVEEIMNSRLPRGDTTDRVGPDEIHARIDMLEDDDISALTYGSVCVNDEEDQKMEIISIQGQKKYAMNEINRHRSEIPSRYCLSYFQKGYF